MADQKLTELGAATAVATTDIIYVVNDPGSSPASKKVTVGDLINFMSGQLIIMEEVFS